MGILRSKVLAFLFILLVLLFLFIGCAGPTQTSQSAPPTSSGSGSPPSGGTGGSGGGSGGSGGGTSGSGGGSGGGGGSTPSSASRFIYGTPGFEAGAVAAGAINNNGQVSAIAGSPFDEGLGSASVIQVTADPKGRFVYLLNVSAMGAGEQIGQAGIGEFSIDRKTGALTRIPGSPIVFNNTFDLFLAPEGTGHFVYGTRASTSLTPDAIDIYSINQSSGALALTSAAANVPPVGQFIVAGNDGQFVFNAGNGLVESYSINPNTGALTGVGAPLGTGGSAGPVAVTNDHKFLYVANQTEGTMAVFAVGSSGALTPVAGSPFAIDTGAQNMALTPDGKFLYVTSSVNGVDGLKGYAVNPSAGTFTPIAGAVEPKMSVVTIDLSGKFAYIGNVTDLFTFSIDPNTGALTQVAHTSGPSSDDSHDLITVP